LLIEAIGIREFLDHFVLAFSQYLAQQFLIAIGQSWHREHLTKETPFSLKEISQRDSEFESIFLMI
jgi:hypothetical protein